MASDTLTFSVDPGLPEDEREALVAALQAADEPSAGQPRFAIATILVIVSVLKDVSTIASGSLAIVTLIEKIKAWRDAARAHGVDPKVTVERPGQSPLDLAMATDAQIDSWFAPDSTRP
jgi:hypothetical protein